MRAWNRARRGTARESEIEEAQSQSRTQPIRGRSTDPTLQHPRCVFQILKRHFSRYTPEMVEETCGIPQAAVSKVAEALCRNSGRERTVGISATRWVGRSTRSACNISGPRHHPVAAGQHGPAGRRHSGAARARFHSRLHRHSHALQPAARLSADAAARSTIRTSRLTYELNESPSGWWGEFPKYSVSLLKAWYGDAATNGK